MSACKDAFSAIIYEGWPIRFDGSKDRYQRSFLNCMLRYWFSWERRENFKFQIRFLCIAKNLLSYSSHKYCTYGTVHSATSKTLFTLYSYAQSARTLKPRTDDLNHSDHLATVQ